MNKNNLLAVLAVLLLIRFGLLPLYDWQQQERTSLESLMQRQAKVNQLMTQFDNADEQQQLLQAYQQELARYIPQVSPPEYRVQLQQEMQQILSDAGAQLELFDWLTETAVADSTVQRVHVQLRFKGKPAAVAAVQTRLEMMPHVRLDNLKASWSESLNIASEVDINADLSVFYMVAMTDE